MDYIINHYSIFKALHIIAVISWMCGMLYLPRLFVYHCQAAAGSELDLTLQTMERKLLRVIINPAMIVTFILGILMIYAIGLNGFGKWLHVKLLIVIALTGVHGMLAIYRKKFATGQNKKSHIYFRVLNEVITLFMIAIVLLAVVKPF